MSAAFHQALLEHFAASSTVDYWGTAITRAHVDDYYRQSAARFDLLVSRVLANAAPGASVAEVGPAYGMVPLQLKAQGFRVSTYEMPEGIPAYCALLQKEGIPVHPWNIHLSDVEAAHDVVIASEVLEHLQISLHAGVAKLARLLGPRGTLVLTVPNAYNLTNVVRVLRGTNIQEPFPEAASVINGVVVDSRTHPREPVLRELLEAVRRAGLEVTHVGHFSSAPRPLLARMAYAVAPKSMRDHLLVEARRGA